MIARRIGTAANLLAEAGEYDVERVLLGAKALAVEGHPVIPQTRSGSSTAAPQRVRHRGAAGHLGSARPAIAAVTPLAAWTLPVPLVEVALGVITAGQ